MTETKTAKWICPCGEETVQPTGPGQKIITHCKCGREHDRMQEPDGSFTDYVTAPDWFKQDWKNSAGVATCLTACSIA